MASPPLPYVVIVSYPDGSGILGAYGPYPNKTQADQAIPRLQKLPGIDPGNQWEAKPLWDLSGPMAVLDG